MTDIIRWNWSPSGTNRTEIDESICVQEEIPLGAIGEPNIRSDRYTAT